MKILVADDDKISRKILEKILSKHGFDVLCASDCDAALEAYKKNDVELVLGDWMMPPTGGLTLVRDIRILDSETGRNCYFIMVSAKTDKEEITRAYEAGVDNFISKPVDENVILARINAGKRVIDNYQRLRDRINELSSN
jgi:DNA-binding response OmpR family regulator